MDRTDRNIDYSNFKDSRIREIIKEFVTVLESNFNKDSLTNFYNNINNVSINRKRLYVLSGDNGYFESDYDDNNPKKIVVRLSISLS